MNISAILSEVEEEMNRFRDSQDQILQRTVLLETEIVRLDSLIKNCNTLGDAEIYFLELSKIQEILAKISFRLNIKLSNGLIEFIRELDRIDDQEARERYFIKLKDRY